MTIPLYLRSAVDDNGYFTSDNRFRLYERRQVLYVLFQGVEYPFPSYDEAIHWMAKQPAAPGSLRIGDAIAKVASTIGIPKCGACAKRQVQFNSIGAKK